MGPQTLKLKAPIQNGSELITELTIQTPKAKHIRNLPGAPKTGDLLDLAGALCGHPPSVINELSIEDTMALLEVVGNFMDVGPKTGAKE